MKGWQIFIHSLRQVFGNLNAALRVSGVLYLAQMLLGLALGASLFMDDKNRAATIAAGEFPWLSLIIVLIVAIIAGLWIAVGWHRYVLLVEEPGFVPKFHGDRIGAYFVKGLIIGLILVIPSVVMVGVASAIGVAARPTVAISPLAEVILLVVLLPIAVLALRMSAILPGVALGEQNEIRLAWEKTKGETQTFVVLVVVWWGVSLVLALASGLLGQVAPILGVAWDFVTGWAVMMVGVSILTTLYGHFIQGRALV